METKKQIPWSCNIRHVMENEISCCQAEVNVSDYECESRNTSMTFFSEKKKTSMVISSRNCSISVSLNTCLLTTILVMLAELIFDNISDGLFGGLHFYHQLCIQALHRNLFEI